MLLEKIDPARVRNVITVINTIRRANKIVQHMEKLVISVVERTTLKAMHRSSEGSKHESERKCRSDRTSKKCPHRCDINEVNECQDDTMKDLMEQVQSLFYHRVEVWE